MADQAVIDAYLGAHHDTDLGDDALLDDGSIEQLEAEEQANQAAAAAAADQEGTR
jgi:branched-chain amino acid transport system ATP-binding protein